MSNDGGIAWKRSGITSERGEIVLESKSVREIEVYS
jgi:hypothetical protein